MRFVCCSHFWFWTGILRPLVSFPFSLQEIGILCVCLCLLIFLSSSVLCCTDILVRSLCMIQSLLCCLYALPLVHLSLSFRFIYASFAPNGPCLVRKWIISTSTLRNIECYESRIYRIIKSNSVRFLVSLRSMLH